MLCSFLNSILVLEYKAVFLCRIVQEMGSCGGLVDFCVYDHSIWSFVLYSFWLVCKFVLLKIELNKFLKFMLIMHAKCLEENILIFC